MTKAREVAGKLTKAQRDAIGRWPERDRPHVWAYPRTMDVLERLGLAEGRVGRSGWALFTPLGLEVRTLIQENPNAD